MTRWRAVLPFLIPSFLFFLFEIIFFFPSLFYKLSSFGLFLALAVIFLLKEDFKFNKISTWPIKFLIISFFLIFSSFLLLIFLEGSISGHLLSFFSSFSFFLFLRNIFLYFHGSLNPSFLENLIFYIILLSSFYLSSALFAFLIFLNIGYALLSIFFFFSLVLLLYPFLYLQKSFSNLLYLLVISLISLELFWVLTFLSTNFYVNGFFLTAVLYLTVGLSHDHLSGKLERTAIKKYLLISFFVLILTLAATRWI